MDSAPTARGSHGSPRASVLRPSLLRPSPLPPSPLRPSLLSAPQNGAAAAELRVWAEGSGLQQRTENRKGWTDRNKWCS